MRQNGLAVQGKKFVGFSGSTIGKTLLRWLTMLCLMPLFLLGGLVLNPWLGWTPSVWLEPYMEQRLETAWQSWLNITNSEKKAPKS